MRELDITEHANVASLFAHYDHDLAVAAALAGVAAGRVFVDDAAPARAAMLQVSRRLYLGGKVPADLVADLHAWFEEEGFPGALASGANILAIYGAPAVWRDALLKILADRHPIRVAREVYEGPTGPRDWQSMLPQGFTLRLVDEALLGSGLKRLDDLREEMCSERPTVEEWLVRSFGVCAVHEDELAGWCLSEYNLDERCEIGIETCEPYRRRGLGAAMAAALIDEAYQRGVQRVGWHCYASNLASAATARKAGLTKVADCVVYEIWADRTWGLAVNGNLAMLDGRQEEALDWLRRAVARGDAHRWVLLRAARVAGALGHEEETLAYLQEALARGGLDREALIGSPELDDLRGAAMWSRLLARL
jgi:RimJ/RimL family protein N-acetyltransferase